MSNNQSGYKNESASGNSNNADNEAHYKNSTFYMIAGLLVLALVLGFSLMGNDTDKNIPRISPAAAEISSEVPVTPPGSIE